MASGIFEQQDIPAPQGGVSPQQAVAPVNNSSVIASATQGLGSLFEGIAQGFSANRKEALQKQSDSTLTAYAQKVSAIDAAYAQGTKTQQEAGRLKRALFNTTIANNPNLTEKLVAFDKGLGDVQGVGDTLANGTAVDQQEAANRKKAVSEGAITSDMTPSQQDAAYQNWTGKQASIAQMDYNAKQLELQSKRLSIVASQESIAASRVNRANAAEQMQERRYKMGVQQGLQGYVAGQYGQTITDLDGISKRLAAGQITSEQAMTEANQMKEQYMGTIMKARGAAGSDFADSLSKPLLDAIDNRAQFFSGKITADVMSQRNKQLQAQAEMPFLSDPLTARLMAAQKLTGGVLNNDIMGQYSSQVVKIIGGNAIPDAPPANPTPHDGQDSKDVSTYLSSVKDSINNLDAKNPAIPDPKGTWNETQTHVNQILAGVSDYASMQRSPSQLNGVMDFLSSPEFLKYQKMNGRVDAAAVEGVKNVVQSNYLDKLVPVIQQEWERGKVVTQTAVAGLGAPVSGGSDAGFNSSKAPDAIEYIWTGQSLTFRPKKGYEKDPRAVAKSRDLNSSVAPLVNKSVRARAYLDGSEDLTKYFEMSKTEMFGTDDEAPTSNEVNGR